jgi:SSS family solute:Na+ symporter
VILLVVFFLLVENSNGLSSMLDSLEPDRRRTLNFSQHGLGDGNTFGFWPMLIGGSFLYVSYYGCDQSQVQRTLSTRNIDESNQALFLNGLLRFPLVLLYCLVGVGIGAFASQNPDFINSLPKVNGVTELNLAVPYFMITNLPNGLVGLSMVALFAAAMSSLDSVLNSLSATTMEDFVTRFYPMMDWKDNTELWCSRAITAVWGIITLVMSFFVGDIASTVLEAINQIGSMANGSILAVFALGLLTHRTNGNGAIMGLVTGISVNASLWAFAPLVSWLWWNVVGFFVTFVIGWGLSLVATPSSNLQPEYLQNLRMANIFTGGYLAAEANIDWSRRCVFMLAWFLTLLILLWMLGG